jgi:hypothetical protein
MGDKTDRRAKLYRQCSNSNYNHNETTQAATKPRLEESMRTQSKYCVGILQRCEISLVILIMICWTDRIDVAYFENSFDALLGVVDRSTFETRLRSFFNHKPTLQDDPAWYALRHTVYASGCRIALSKQSPLAPFAEAQERAWQFFENALSVHTELLYCATSLVAVQALTAMVRLLSSLKRQD